MEGQDKFVFVIVMRELDNADVGLSLREDCEEDLVDVGWNADIYVANHNQESTDSIQEVHVHVGRMWLAGECSVRPLC